MNKKGFEFSFAWMFAVIVGAVVLFLAIYVTIRLVSVEKTASSAEQSAQFGTLLTPVETTLESGKSSVITLSGDSRFFNGCESKGAFGRQSIGIVTKVSISGDWGEPENPSTFYNKYIFSANVVEDREMVVFSKPLEMPFKIADLVYIVGREEKYCFVNPPRELEEDVESLLANSGLFVNITNSMKYCLKDSVKVCFNSNGCDVDVSLENSNELRGTISKGFSKGIYFDGLPLLFGAIFSDPGIYDCQTKRLMKRASELSLIYISKSDYLSSKECGSSSLQPLLIDYSQRTADINKTIEIRDVAIIAKEIGRQNSALTCRLF